MKKRFGAVSYSTAKPDARTQPPRLYAAFSSGGGVVSNEAVAAGLQRSGFDVAEFTPGAAERAWLTISYPGMDWTRTFLVRCATMVTEDERGIRVCGYPDLEEVSQEGAVRAGLRSEDFLPVARLVGNAKVRYRFYLPKAPPNQSEVLLAAEAVKKYDELAFNVKALQPVMQICGSRLPYKATGPYLHGVQTLVQYAQPVEEYRKLVRQGQANRVGVAVETVILYAAVTLAVIAVGTAAVVVMARAIKSLDQANNEVLLSREETDQSLIKMLKDPNLTPAERLVILEYMKTKAENQPKTTSESLADAAKVAVPALVIGALLWYGSPVIKEIGASVAEKIRGRREKLALAR